jgi:hypothetical protein
MAETLRLCSGWALICKKGTVQDCAKNERILSRRANGRMCETFFLVGTTAVPV